MSFWRFCELTTKAHRGQLCRLSQRQISANRASFDGRRKKKRSVPLGPIDEFRKRAGFRHVMATLENKVDCSYAGNWVNRRSVIVVISSPAETCSLRRRAIKRNFLLVMGHQVLMEAGNCRNFKFRSNSLIFTFYWRKNQKATEFS